MHVPDRAEDAAWKRRFRARHIDYAAIASYHPGRGVVVTQQDGLYRLHAWDVESETLHPLTEPRREEIFAGISPDGGYIYYHDGDASGAGHYVRLPFESSTDATPESLTPAMPPYGYMSLSQSLDGRVLGFSLMDGMTFSVYTMPLTGGEPGEPRALLRSETMAYGPILSHDADFAVVSITGGDGDGWLAAYRLDDPSAPLRELVDDDATIVPVAFAPAAGSSALLASSDRDGGMRPLVWDVATGDRLDVPLQDMDGDVWPLGWSPDGTRLLLHRRYQAQDALYVYDLEHSTLTRLDVPPGTIETGYFADDTMVYVLLEDATAPPRLIAINANANGEPSVVLHADDVPPGRPWRSVWINPEGEMPVQAWLATPDGDGPFPLVIHAHDGPTAVQTETYHAEAQTWLDHGVAWLSVNYRGSITFGRAFTGAIFGILGHREVDDLVAAANWAVENGIARDDAVLLTGESYGGYLVLQALGRAPERWAGGIARDAIADWAMLYEAEPEALQGYTAMLFGGTPDDSPKLYRASSPTTYVEAVTAPILAIHREGDPQMQTYVDTLNAAGGHIDVHWYSENTTWEPVTGAITAMQLALNWAYTLLAR